MKELVDLIAKLESAAEGSRELSDAVLEELGWIWKGHVWHKPDGKDVFAHEQPCPTTNLQDTVDAVPEGWVIEMSLETPPTFATAILSPIINGGQGSEGVKYANAATPALALSAAIARAKMEGS